jgi:uncharacterized membrane protein
VRHNDPMSYPGDDQTQPADPNQPNAYGPGGYPPGGYPSGGYPAGGYGFPQPHPQGTTVLVLGILGLVVCFIPGIVGLVLGNRALREIDANPAAYNNRQNVVVGRILGIIGIVWQVLGILAYVLIVVLALVASQGA